VIKDGKIPFYEKLPKDSAFYKHYMSVLQQSRLQEVCSKKVMEDRQVFKHAAETIASTPMPFSKLMKVM
jgi:hypothetical protein